MSQRCDLIFRVFVSSTFSDLKVERDALHKEAFPKLRKYCQERNARFQAIDLRWGVSQEAALDQQTMNICFQELARCQEMSPRPNFIVLLRRSVTRSPISRQEDMSWWKFSGKQREVLDLTSYKEVELVCPCSVDASGKARKRRHSTVMMMP